MGSLSLGLMPPATAAEAPRAESQVAAAQPFPVFAYYYIWYQASSWNRAKSDYPLLGRYSSDDAHVMREHIRQAKSAGLSGFLVSWKHTPVLDRRLAQLVDIAHTERFNLGIVYQGLDFSRKPLPIQRVQDDLLLFKQRYAADPAFAAFGHPVVIWTGTESYSTAAIRQVTSALSPDILVLASAKSVADYQRVAAVVDGDAYYWSSVNPTGSRYPDKLKQMSAAVHANHGLWIAPAAPGFDARLVGGTSVVGRDGGRTLLRELDAARGSSPDAIGLISWNEFSENSHVEPSREYGDSTLRTLKAALSGSVTVDDSPDSSSAVGSMSRSQGAALVGSAAVALGAVLALARLMRSRRRGRRTARALAARRSVPDQG